MARSRSRATPRIRRAPPQARRADLLDAAERCFAERGYHETTVDAIAQRAGVSKGAFYWHFESKRDAFSALVDRTIERARPAWEAVSAVPDAAAAVRGLSELALDETQRTLSLVPASLEYMAEASRDPALARRLVEYLQLGRQIVSDQLRRGAAQGVFRDVDADACATAIVAAGDALGIHGVFDRELDVARAWHALVDLVLRGLAR